MNDITNLLSVFALDARFSKFRNTIEKSFQIKHFGSIDLNKIKKEEGNVNPIRGIVSFTSFRRFDQKRLFKYFVYRTCELMERLGIPPKGAGVLIVSNRLNQSRIVLQFHKMQTYRAGLKKETSSNIFITKTKYLKSPSD